MKHDDFVGTVQEPQELYAVKKHFSIQVEGDPDFFFDVSLVQEDREEELDQQEVLPTAVDDEFMGQNHSRRNDLVVALTGLLDVDDDNEPVPRTFQYILPILLLQCCLRSGDMKDSVCGNPTTFRMQKQNLYIQSTQQEMTLTFNWFSAFSLGHSWRMS